ncbi:hypothetical protein CYY_007217 [Polysphondylium violaceum]|uniref:FNIP repeat-containing protein n=1 Tax=Polysphondylium violaceum TaxID=133409 RepID=A0A8J4PS65_9MYCE|nr:hypothetical protein CYY_007217 [Polysphondylium violaceum]
MSDLNSNSRNNKNNNSILFFQIYRHKIIKANIFRFKGNGYSLRAHIESDYKDYNILKRFSSCDLTMTLLNLNNITSVLNNLMSLRIDFLTLKIDKFIINLDSIAPKTKDLLLNNIKINEMVVSNRYTGIVPNSVEKLCILYEAQNVIDLNHIVVPKNTSHLHLQTLYYGPLQDNTSEYCFGSNIRHLTLVRINVRCIPSIFETNIKHLEIHLLNEIVKISKKILPSALECLEISVCKEVILKSVPSTLKSLTVLQSSVRCHADFQFPASVTKLNAPKLNCTVPLPPNLTLLGAHKILDRPLPPTLESLKITDQKLSHPLPSSLKDLTLILISKEYELLLPSNLIPQSLKTLNLLALTPNNTDNFKDVELPKQCDVNVTCALNVSPLNSQFSNQIKRALVTKFLLTPQDIPNNVSTVFLNTSKVTSIPESVTELHLVPTMGELKVLGSFLEEPSNIVSLGINCKGSIKLDQLPTNIKHLKIYNAHEFVQGDLPNHITHFYLNTEYSFTDPMFDSPLSNNLQVFKLNRSSSYSILKFIPPKIDYFETKVKGLDFTFKKMITDINHPFFNCKKTNILKITRNDFDQLNDLDNDDKFDSYI